MSRYLAHLISWLFNPGVLILTLLLVGVAASPMSPATTIGWLIAIGLAVIVGLIILLVTWAHGLVIDVDLMTPINLRDRSRILLFFLAVLTFLLFGSFRGGQAEPFHTILITMLVLGGLVAAITLFWKISLHMLSVGMVTTALLLIFGPRLWPVSLLIPTVSWARLRLHRHTPYQLIGGFLLGVITTSVIFWWAGLI